MVGVVVGGQGEVDHVKLFRLHHDRNQAGSGTFRLGRYVLHVAGQVGVDYHYLRATLEQITRLAKSPYCQVIVRNLKGSDLRGD
jgi:hypothetical protein